MQGNIHPSCIFFLRNPSVHQLRQFLFLILNWCQRTYPKAGWTQAPRCRVPVWDPEPLAESKSLLRFNHDITAWCSAWRSTCHAAWSDVDSLRIRVHLEAKKTRLFIPYRLCYAFLCLKNTHMLCIPRCTLEVAWSGILARTPWRGARAPRWGPPRHGWLQNSALPPPQWRPSCSQEELWKNNQGSPTWERNIIKKRVTSIRLEKCESAHLHAARGWSCGASPGSGCTGCSRWRCGCRKDAEGWSPWPAEAPETASRCQECPHTPDEWEAVKD